MAVIVSHGAFKSALTACRQFVPSRTTIPALSAVRISVDAGSMTLSATDLVCSFQQSLPCEGSGDWVLSADAVAAFVAANIKSEDISIDGANIVTMKAGRARAQIQAMDPGSFPEIFVNHPDWNAAVKMEAAPFIAAIKKTAMAAQDISGRYFARGVYISAHGGKLRIEACSGYSLHRFYLPCGNAELDPILLDKDIVTNIVAVMAGASEIEMAMSDGLLWFRAGDLRIASKLIDAQYPEGALAFKPHAMPEIEIDTASLHAAIGAAKGMEDRAGRAMFFNIDGIESFVMAERDGNNIRVPFDATGAPHSFWANSGLVQNALAACSAETVKFAIDGDHKWLIDGDQARALIMAMRGREVAVDDVKAIAA